MIGTTRRASESPRQEPPRVRILVADDSPIARQMLVSFVRRQCGLRLVGTACHGAEAVELVGTCRPDLVLMDWQMCVMDGLEATRRVKARADAPRVIIVTADGGSSGPAAAAAAGADGFLLKDELAEQLPPLIKKLFPDHDG